MANANFYKDLLQGPSNENVNTKSEKNNKYTFPPLLQLAI